MPEQIGFVRENLKDGFAVVVTDRKGACSGCHSDDGCRSCLSTGTKIESRVSNPINAQAGEVVRISLRNSDLFKGAALFYLLPVACVIAGALIGLNVNWASGLSVTSRPVLGGLIGLVVGIGTAMLVGRSRYARKHLSPSITSVISSGTGQPVNKPHSCCC